MADARLRVDRVDPSHIREPGITVSVAWQSAVGGRHRHGNLGPQKVFEHLIGNALKFCRPGDTVGSRRDGAVVRFWVGDSGPGIEADRLAAL